MELKKYQQDLVDSVESLLNKSIVERNCESIEYYKRMLNLIRDSEKIKTIQGMIHFRDEMVLDEMFMHQAGGIPAGQIYVYSTPKEKNTDAVALLYDLYNKEKFKAVITKPSFIGEDLEVQVKPPKPPKNKKWFHQFDRKRRY